MNKKIEDVLFEALKPVDEPDPELNRRILERRVKKNMKKRSIRKIAAAAAIGILVAAGGVSAYATSQNISLLSLFAGESSEVKHEAERLLDTEVKQSSEKEQSELASFKIREAIADKNKVTVQVEVKAADPDKYLLVPEGIEVDMSVENLEMEGLKGKQSIAEYAESTGKKCLCVGAMVDVPAHSGMHETQPDGTLLLYISFENTEKKQKLDYVCDTSAYIVGDEEDDVIENKINFTLTDNTDVEIIKYLPVKIGKVPGTDLVIDEVTFEKSNLEMVCNVRYHYAGKSKDWVNTDDYDTCFFLLDSDGKIIDHGEGGSEENGTEVTQRWEYSLKELPETITFRAKNVMDKTLYGKAKMKLS